MILRTYVVLMAAYGGATLASKLYPSGAASGFSVGPIQATWVMVVCLLTLGFAFYKTGKH